ncbi:MAG: hypothetical protein ABIZ04_05630 [Opitutus sp.]
MNDVTAPPRARLTRQLIALLWAIALGIYCFVPVSTVLDTSLDASNYASYTRFAAEQRQFGTEVVPMAGPFGFVVYGWVYNGDLYGLRLVLEFATKLIFGLFVLWFFRRSNGSRIGWLWLIANLLVLPTTTELTYDLSVLYAALLLIFERPRRWLTLATVFFLAFLALCKGTQLIFTLAVLAVVAGEVAWRRAWADLAILIGGFLASLVILWCAAGQELQHLPAYIRNIQELSTGYVSGMALQETTQTFIIGVASVVVALAGLLILLAPHRRDSSLITATCVLLGFTFLEWKHGFVRADGHVFLFFHYCILGSVTLLALDVVGRKQVHFFRTRALLAAIATVLALYGTGAGIAVRFAEYGRALAANIPSALQQLAHPIARKQQLAARLAENRVRFRLPETIEHVQDHTIGFFGYESGYLALNGLNEIPSPVAGGGPFSVFTPHLQRLNEQHLLTPETSPLFYLVKLQTIDERYIPQDDARSLNALLRLYQPVLAERGMLLMRKSDAAQKATAPADREVNHAAIRLGQPVPVPNVGQDEMLLVSFELPPSPAAVVRSTLYKAPIVSLTLTIDGEPTALTRRIIPSMASAPFILFPLLEQTSDLLALYSPEEGGRPRTIQLNCEPTSGLGWSNCSVTFYARTRPTALEPGRKKEIAGQFAYPSANLKPTVVEASNARLKEIDGRTVQLLEPPGRIVFPLHGDERELGFDYGFDPESYTRGTTDGADFIVELLPASGPAEQLFLSRRDPKNMAADRGRQHAHLWLPLLKPGTQLQLRTGGGLRGAADWDWTYYDNIQLHRGPLRVEQFAGFGVAPSDVGGAEPRMIQHEGRDVLLLNAPGAIEFILTGKERRIQFLGGFMPGAYLEGNTDGAEFVVELIETGQASKTIYARMVTPKTVVADRGTQTFDIPLPAYQAGSKLKVRTSVGPHHDASWDWTYVAEVRFSGSP